MDVLAQYVKALAVFMVLASVCQIIIPEGRFKGAVSLITGIMLMLIILKPVNAVLNSDEEGYVKNSIKLSTYTAKNELLQYSDSSDIVIAGFEKACADILNHELKAVSLSVKAVNGEDGVYISEVKVNAVSSDVENIKKRVSEICGIDGEKVNVINQGKGEYNEANK